MKTQGLKLNFESREEFCFACFWVPYRRFVAEVVEVSSSDEAVSSLIAWSASDEDVGVFGGWVTFEDGLSTG